MDRIKITLPVAPRFFTELTIRITDLNYGGHVGNDSFLSLLHEARQQFLLQHGYTELAFEGVSLIMADAAIEYKRELNHANRIRIGVVAHGFDKLGFDLFYQMELWENESWTLAARAKTGMMCYDYSLHKRAAIPAAAIGKLEPAQP